MQRHSPVNTEAWLGFPLHHVCMINDVIFCRQAYFETNVTCDCFNERDVLKEEVDSV